MTSLLFAFLISLAKKDSKILLLEHLRFSLKPKCVWPFFFLYVPMGFLQVSQAEAPRFYDVGMSEEQISHSHQERLSQGQILHKEHRHTSKLGGIYVYCDVCTNIYIYIYKLYIYISYIYRWIELNDMNRKGNAVA